MFHLFEDDEDTPKDGAHELSEVTSEPSAIDSRTAQQELNNHSNAKQRILAWMKLHESKQNTGKWILVGQDCARLIFSEIFVYSIIMCTIIRHASSGNRDSVDFNHSKHEGAKFIFLLFMYFIFYLIRFFIIIAVLKSIKRQLPRDNCYSFWRFSVVFVLHHIGQCFLQVVIAVGLWIRIEFEYDRLCYTPYFWCSVVLGYFVPFMGNFAFFIPEYYFVEELLIRSYTSEDSSKQLDVEYKEKACCLKWLYSYISPLIVILSLLYLSLLSLFAFLSFASNNAYVDALDNSLGCAWIYYYFVMILCITVINIQVILIALFWVSVISTVLFIVGGFLFLSLPYLVLSSPFIVVYFLLYYGYHHKP